MECFLTFYVQGLFFFSKLAPFGTFQPFWNLSNCRRFEDSRTSYTFSERDSRSFTFDSAPVSLQNYGGRRSWPNSRRSTTTPKPIRITIETKIQDDWQQLILDWEVHWWEWWPWGAPRKRGLRNELPFNSSLSSTVTRKYHDLLHVSSCLEELCLRTLKCLDLFCRCVISGCTTKYAQR